MIVPHSNLQEFTRVAEWQLGSGEDAGFFNMHGLLKTLAFDCDYLPETTNAELHEILRDPLELPSSWQYNHIVAETRPNWQVRYGYLPTMDDFIRSNPAHMIICVIGPEPLVVDYYTASQNIDTDVFDAAAFLQPPEREIFQPGELCLIDSAVDLADVVVDKPTAALWLRGRTRRSIQWLFSRHTLKSVQAAASKAADADTVNLIRGIVALRSAASVPTLCALTSHSSHLVRVEALQALTALDPECARASLQRATNDEHPHVRFASEKSIAALAA
jgi:hypothetical protein